ncbi:hypothetical protein PtrSN002B_011740 [Pyrenophora tritici-repentis]|nr:hypothetical protein PtrSN002B_011740 [Pyrenophora tritici-repentis]KAI1533962.1 hypothetical protein PtrSN001A_006614 [Pyrenophora tritici-repentis]KAI1537283.1 hypothetical protein PtrSN001C_006200 [Pyrenophora tritici-repentis]KAI1575229.1 hypothetical protein PtrEW7m1_006597 [Pyrenophora tritici-repentis]KAI1588900.1 hypothetical protein PtrEW13061_006603 [Pyrenophora tritici-repentis]
MESPTVSSDVRGFPGRQFSSAKLLAKEDEKVDVPRYMPKGLTFNHVPAENVAVWVTADEIAVEDSAVDKITAEKATIEDVPVARATMKNARAMKVLSKNQSSAIFLEQHGYSVFQDSDERHGPV